MCSSAPVCLRWTRPPARPACPRNARRLKSRYDLAMPPLAVALMRRLSSITAKGRRVANHSLQATAQTQRCDDVYFCSAPTVAVMPIVFRNRFQILWISRHGEAAATRKEFPFEFAHLLLGIASWITGRTGFSGGCTSDFGGHPDPFGALACGALGVRAMTVLQGCITV